MDQADVLYRAFLEYRKLTTADEACSGQRESIRSASSESDRIETVSSRCIIDEEWVDRIYEGLVYVEKAIQEERQFIRQQGEVVPIEKVRRVSKGSVEHLAKHSELMTHEPEEDGNIIPDKIFMVEKLSDYAIYENRFLYMMLCYLRDFIEMRYSKIIEHGSTYKASYDSDKEITMGKRRIAYTVHFRESSNTDPYGLGGDPTFSQLLKKIEEERHLVAAFLMTPLMKKVAEAPLLKPPVTRTNVLKMNINFKSALELYDYLVSYTAPGYTIEYTKKEISPFPDRIGDEFAEFTALTSFMVYQYGKGAKDIFARLYEEEEERRRLAEREKQREKLDLLKKRVSESGKSMEEYMLLLEERNRSLEGDSVKLGETSVKLSEVSEALEQVRIRQDELLSEINDLKESNEVKDRRIFDISAEAEEKLSRMRTDLDEEKRKFVAENRAKMAEIQKECTEKVASANKDRDTRVSNAEAQLEAIRREDLLLRAELLGNKQINGSIVEEGDFTSRERFIELERMYNALGDYIKKQWKLTKKEIRKKVLWKKVEKANEDSLPSTDLPHDGDQQ